MVVATPTKTEQRRRRALDGLTLRDLISNWEFHNQTEGKSPHTVAWYNDTLGAFERFLERNQRSLLLADIGEPEVRDFIADMREHRWPNGFEKEARPGGLTPESIQTRVRALKAFFAWLHREEFTDTHRLARLGNYKAPRELVAVLTDDEVATILKVCNQKQDWGMRDYAMVTLMLDTGLRRAEVVGLRTADVSIDGGWLKVMGKGGKERIVPFGTVTQRVLWRYFRQYRAEPLGEDVYFFLTLDGRPLSKDGFASIFVRLRRRSGVTRLRPHLLRHTFATRYLIHGGDVFSLKQILGHTTLEMVQRYVNLASAQVSGQHRKFSPMDRMLGAPRDDRRLRAGLR